MRAFLIEHDGVHSFDSVNSVLASEARWRPGLATGTKLYLENTDQTVWSGVRGV